MIRVLKYSIFFVLIIVKFGLAQVSAEEKLSLMQNNLLLGLEKEGVNIGAEIISLSRFSPVREKAIFILAEYFFTKGVLGNIDNAKRLSRSDLPDINKSYTLYAMLLKDYSQGDFYEIAKQRFKYLEKHFEEHLLFRRLDNYLENEKLIVVKKLRFLSLFIKKEKENPFLFFTEGNDPNTYKLVNRYLDDIIINNPSQAIYAYYFKLLTVLSRSADVDIISGVFENKSFSVRNYKEYKQEEDEFNMIKDRSYEYEEVIKNAINILNIMGEKAPHHPLTIKAYLVTVSYFIKAGYWENDSPEVKKWLELALKNDNDKLGIKYLVTKEYLLKTDFKEK